MDFQSSKYPAAPGVYLMRGSDGQVLYVGKAKRLRNRLRGYFSAAGDGRGHIRFLMARVATIDTIVTDTEKEALILENLLIKEHRPRYNIDLRDDKTYLSLRIDLNEEFPTVNLTRRVVNDGALYFGPYSSTGAIRSTLKTLRQVFPLRQHDLATCRRRGRPCLYFQLDQCSGPCHGKISAPDYRKLVDGVIALLGGRESEVLADLQRRMTRAAQELRYEDAGALRDQIRAINKSVEQQKVVIAAGGDRDVVGLHREGGEVEIALLCVRQGKLLDRRDFNLDWRLDEDELLSSFLREFYAREVLIPGEILLPFLPSDSATLGEWLSERRGRKVTLLAPQRGPRAELVQLAARNASEAQRERGSRRAARTTLLNDLAARFHLPVLPTRIECFDISNIQGSFNVGSMAVVINGEPEKSAYRHYRIREISGADDFAALGEVLRRRLRRGIEEGVLPDLLLIDGGKGQLGAVVAVLEELGLLGRVAVVGMAKSRVRANVRGKAVERSEERFFLPGRKNPVTLRQGSAVLFLLERLRDEAHRFAITHHRQLRGKAALQSTLEDIPGIGAARRKLLLKQFGSVKKIRAAQLAELLAVAGLPETTAREVFAFFHSQQV
ncbi:MAG: excinuclease ABC subunit UvrC [Desulfuromonadales bacterium]|nr:excinuclease ABC subunit UvrC [Desulfuromonadales bacterium]MDT8423550.1 excinuclease ABC subunit UvrC [Desulfuromonadales bacterium]